MAAVLLLLRKVLPPATTAAAAYLTASYFHKKKDEEEHERRSAAVAYTYTATPYTAGNYDVIKAHMAYRAAEENREKTDHSGTSSPSPSSVSVASPSENSTGVAPGVATGVAPGVAKNVGVPTYDVVVVGAGIVGLATARLIALTYPEKSVCVLEKEGEVAAHQSGHNSGVIHAGIYYKPGSNMAKVCCAPKALSLDSKTAATVTTQAKRLVKGRGLKEGSCK